MMNVGYMIIPVVLFVSGIFLLLLSLSPRNEAG